ncbi:hypothetical protein SAMN05421819_2174 [Bryocella elongata]|uniref:Lipocalin-like domain-containing protein n=1 Tax=Bryocella elongata TaxID=863522 RepID=A0A1H5Y8F1_9BACT|nr:hypothetical protein [Bryocella elongata]SEG20234.1 hypothetical protein SAMN05421819_2174 [Bryocella elongata]
MKKRKVPELRLLGTRASRVAALMVVFASLSQTIAAEPLPAGLRGSWRITRVLPTHNVTCWSREQADQLVGSTLTYATRAMSWKGGTVALSEINVRSVSAEQFAKENGSEQGRASFEQVGIRSRNVTEVDLQHEDMDITGATTEVPGDAVLLAGPNRIVVSACGVYFEATRSGMAQVASR